MFPPPHQLLLLLLLFCMCFFSLSSFSTLYLPRLAFTLRHYAKISFAKINPTNRAKSSLSLFQHTNEHEMEWNGNWYANFQVSAEKVIIFAPIYLWPVHIFNNSLSFSLFSPTTMCCSPECLYLIMSSSFVQQFTQREMRLLRWLLKTIAEIIRISVVGWLYFTNH